MKQASFEAIPSVGVCPHDLQFAASMLAQAFGCPCPETPVAIVQRAVDQATQELRFVASGLEQDDLRVMLDNIADRLDAAAETAEILFKLFQLPSNGTLLAVAGEP